MTRVDADLARTRIIFAQCGIVAIAAVLRCACSSYEGRTDLQEEIEVWRDHSLKFIDDWILSKFNDDEAY
jgi:hypothetical protein